MMPAASICRRCARPRVSSAICGWCGTKHHDNAPMPQRQFYVLQLAWNGRRDIAYEVFFGLSVPDDGTLGEMSMVWYRQGSSQDPLSQASPRLEVFCDAWVILERFRDVVVALAERDSVKTRHNLTPQEFIELLKGLGFVDVTPRLRPAAPDDPR